MTYEPNRNTVIGICQKVNSVEGMDDDGFFSPVKCNTSVDFNHLRATDWECPMCGQKGNKEMWMPTTVGSVFRRVA